MEEREQSAREERSSISNPGFISDVHVRFQGVVSAFLGRELVDGVCAPSPRFREAWATKGKP
jgi:hypothetical protein